VAHWSKSIEQLSARVLLFNLQPLTVGQLFTLHQIGSPFVGEKDEATLDDLALAVVACSVTPKSFNSISRRFWFPMFLRIWGRLCSHLDWNKEAKRFVDYISENLDFAAIKASDDQKKTRKVFAPITYRLLLSLLRFGHDEKSVLEMSVWEASRRWLVIMEESERVELREDDIDLIERLYCKSKEEVLNGVV